MPDEVTWVPALGRYRLPSGRFVSRLTVRTTFEQSLANLTKLTDSLAGDLRAGRISLNAWLDEMRDIVKQTHMAAAELARGGRAQMTPSDYGRVGQAVRRQYEFLDRWVAEIKDGGSLQTEGRARQYLRASRSHYLSREAEEMERRGYLARNVLRPGESCAECIAETSKGLVAPRFISPPGTRVCRGNCNCFLAFEKVA